MINIPQERVGQGHLPWTVCEAFGYGTFYELLIALILNLSGIFDKY